MTVHAGERSPECMTTCAVVIFRVKVSCITSDDIQGAQKFVPIVYCILCKAFNASLGKFTLIQVRNLSK